MNLPTREGGEPTIHRDLAALDTALEALAARFERPCAGPAGLCGFDGFVDTLLRVEAPDTMAEFGPAVAGAAGIAASYPVVHCGEKFGGNGPLLATALHVLLGGSVDITYVGALGRDGLLPIFQDALGSRMRRVISVADPARSECLEFRDGKVMLSDTRECSSVTWEGLEARLASDELDGLLRSVRFVAAANWGKLIHAGSIWVNLAARLAAVGAPPKSVLFFMDLAEFEPRSAADKATLPAMFARINAQCETVLSLNLKEAWQLAAVVGGSFHGRRRPTDVAALAGFLQQQLDLDRVVVHPNDGAACASEVGSIWIPGPVCRRPLTSVGAGDHFGAGCLAAALRGGDDVEMLLGGVCASGYFVRTGRAPAPHELAAFVRAWLAGPVPERLE